MTLAPELIVLVQEQIALASELIYLYMRLVPDLIMFDQKQILLASELIRIYDISSVANSTSFRVNK